MELTTSSITWLHYLFFFLHVLLLWSPIPCCSANDCLEEGHQIGTNITLISPGEVFELGFFTPDNDTLKSRYLGIWYYNQSDPKIVVWVANRDKPLLDTNGYLIINDNFAKVLDTKGTVYWLTNSVQSETESVQEQPGTADSGHTSNNNSGVTQFKFQAIRNSARLCLDDSGNLKLRRRDLGGQILWESFQNPTDTFLPRMNNGAEGNLRLISWKAPNNPAQGSYVFTLKQQDNGNNKLLISRSPASSSVQHYYWESGVTPFDQTPRVLLSLLLANDSQISDYNTSRLVMKFTGQIQFWKRESKIGGKWSLVWSEPKDECSLYEACGILSSCNSDDGLLCKCLPGSIPNNPEKWNLGHFSQGCFLTSEPCPRNFSDDVFLRMPMMKTMTAKSNDTNVADCETSCREDCTCLAYSCGLSDCTRTDVSDEKRCLTWSSSELTDLQEEFSGGLTIYVRTPRSDTESTSRDCNTCGSYIIPYPLSTAANCGDSSYFQFKCNLTTGQLYFSTGDLTFKITSINQDAKSFTIQVGHGNSCGSRYTNSSVLLSKDSLPYNVLNCKVLKVQFSLETEQSFIEVEMGWKPPPEPTCNESSDCHDWRHTTCEKAEGGKTRCKCGSRYHWDGSNLKCAKVTAVKVVIPCVAGALAIILLYGLYFSHRIWKRRLNEPQEPGVFNGDDTEGIEVPFFNWETILAANNFADANKLGTGGFGSVFMGNLTDGQEIAVKRLSSVSVQGVEEFRTEVKLIAKLQHRNLVRLIGYCMKADEKILVYEYMPNGSLDSCLFDEKHFVILDWKKRFDIILGISRGLLYLHQDSRLRIIHRDLKPSNILLDEELNPKISDFGIAKIVGGKETQASTGRIVGTYGYMSPEYASDGIFSVKSDVFSFGVVILETISGKRNSRIFMFEHGLSLLGHAWKLWNENKGLELMDAKLHGSCFPSEVVKCIHIGLLCVQEDPSDRPSMSTVVHMLSGENASLPLAKQPAFLNRKPFSDTASSSSAKDSSMQEMMTISTVGR